MARRIRQPAPPDLSEDDALLALHRIEAHLIPTTMERNPDGLGWTASTADGREKLTLLDQVRSLRRRCEQDGLTAFETLAEVRALVEEAPAVR